MTDLRPIINVREIPPLYSQLRRELPSLRSYAWPTPAPYEQSALAYLAQGVVCGICYDKGMLYDVLQPDRSVDRTRHLGETGEARLVQPNLLLTDGVWLWPGALLYYLEEYHLRLPQEFVRHAECQGWRIDPSAVKVEELNSGAFDGVPSWNEKTS